jgi:hypothetical protein
MATDNPLLSTVDLRAVGIEQQLLADPATSHWLRDALEATRDRDPLDALNDGSALHAVLAERWLVIEQAHKQQVGTDVTA